MSTRREFIRHAAAAAGALSIGATVPCHTDAQEVSPVKIGMCDWSLGARAKIDAISRAADSTLSGVEVSLGVPGDFSLRAPTVRAAYLDAAREKGVELPSMALGCLNSVPLKSEPVTALWCADCIEAARDLGAKVILMAFFGAGALDMADEKSISRVVEVLKELAPRAADAGVILGLENTLSADDNLRIIEQVAHDSVRVYYDFKNSANAERDTSAEVRQLGDLICQVHLKNGKKLLEDIDNVNWPDAAQALKDIDYQGWLVLETSAPSGDLIADTRRNADYVRQTFA